MIIDNSGTFTAKFSCEFEYFNLINTLILFAGDCLGATHLGKASHWNIHRYLYMPFVKTLHSFLMSVSTV